MLPADFRDFVLGIAARRGLDPAHVVLGGDHLGPVVWAAEPADVAMEKAGILIEAFAAAGFSKIHLDCSMPLVGDPGVLDDAVVARRAAQLCARAEGAAQRAFGHSEIIYVIGTEVPPPGGADEDLTVVEVTPVGRAQQTLETHRSAFAKAGLNAAWDRVVAMVVQPGVEFDHRVVIDFVPGQADALRRFAQEQPLPLVFEAHSTDYQLPDALSALVSGHFAILKVGPALTFALREALFALSHIEDELCSADQRSNLRALCEQVMIERPEHWRRFYKGDEHELGLLRRYSLSDRIRYYWPDPVLVAGVDRMFGNLERTEISLGLLAQYMPAQFEAVRAGDVPCRARDLVTDHIRRALRPYVRACAQNEDIYGG